MPDPLKEAKQAYEESLHVASLAIQRANKVGLSVETQAFAYDYATLCIENSQRAFAYYIKVLSEPE